MEIPAEVAFGDKTVYRHVPRSADESLVVLVPSRDTTLVEQECFTASDLCVNTIPIFLSDRTFEKNGLGLNVTVAVTIS
jgi:hypothetical protein